jgi:RNA polymerase sigma-70 factor (ECF subfamily)
MHGRMDDLELMAAIRAGRQDALRVLFERHAPWLTARLHRRWNDPGLVDEAIQDTFLAVWRRPGGFDPDRGSVGAWLWGIAVRRLIDQLRRRSRTTATTARLRAMPPDRSAEDEALSVDLGDVGDALDRLSPELQNVLRATVLDGLTTSEAAVLLDIPVGTVKTRLMRARRELREVIA